MPNLKRHKSNVEGKQKARLICFGCYFKKMEISNYAKGLDERRKKEYVSKIAAIAAKDPYLLKCTEQCLPKNVNYVKIINYLLQGRNTVTGGKLESNKALSAGKLYQSGWVQSMEGFQHSELCFILSKVLHTQSLNLPALRVWIAVDKDGFIKTAHCTCVAGLGECCTHIGGTLFALESIARKFEEDNLISVTDMKAYWKVPSCKLKLQVPCEKIKWNKSSQSAQKGKRQVQPASCAQVVEFLKSLRDKGCEVSAMSSFEALVPEQDLCLSIEERELIPMYMANVFKIEYEGLDKREIEKISGMLVFRLTTEQVNFAASITKQQSKCHYWHKLRIGRITASIFKQAARTNLKIFYLTQTTNRED
ncbi:uncharacterized protein LOC129940472 [Eupeodes corollae]|uniref:uncharacterized protein LOC129940472 n=1 Tax=Eupeodes corollae TaxID=290404 RepID=UPI0024911704|nr:uncharacterized protein LOC129940472 [Eupeodes corollae]